MEYQVKSFLHRIATKRASRFGSNIIFDLLDHVFLDKRCQRANYCLPQTNILSIGGGSMPVELNLL